MYPRKPFHNIQHKLEHHYGHGQAEYLKQYKSFINMYSNADLERELRERRSTASIILLTNGIATHWDISKQGILKVSDIRNFSSSIGYSIGDPSTVYKDNT
eukprot:5403965-Ditylum_brightwellii.AAC.1